MPGTAYDCGKTVEALKKYLAGYAPRGMMMEDRGKPLLFGANPTLVQFSGLRLTKRERYRGQMKASGTRVRVPRR
jgi:hypothetical protein